MARTNLPPAEHAAWRELEAVERALTDLPAGESFGMIHYDFELDNICWDGLTPAILDFDDCGPHWFAADIAFALRDLFEDRGSRVNLEDERFQAFLRSYRAQRSIDQDALRLIPLFLRWHNLVGFARIAYSIFDTSPQSTPRKFNLRGPQSENILSDGAAGDEPQWLTNLRSHLGKIQDGYRQEFEDHPLGSFWPG